MTANPVPLTALLLIAAAVRAQEAPLSLEQVLNLARLANAQLPIVQQDVAAAQARGLQASGQFLPQLSALSDLQVAHGGSTYGGVNGTPGEDRLQVMVRQPVYAGGELVARRSLAQASARAARWIFRMAEKDLELEVSTQFATFLAAESEIGFRREGLDRLQTYLVSVRSRRAAGVAVASDVFKTEARIADEEANLAAAQRQLDDARLQLNELMGRSPVAPLTLHPLPEPEAPPIGGDLSWQRVPDLAMARAVAEAATAGGELVRATRRPHLDLAGDVGLFGPGLNGGSLGSRLRTDFGSTLTLTLTWPFLDFGIYAGRRTEADALAVQAERRLAAQTRRSRLEWERANSQLAGLYREIEARRRAVPIARDSYLSAESLYRGGSGTALEVLDAYSSLIGASRSYALAVLAYRVAQAQSIRWGSP